MYKLALIAGLLILSAGCASNHSPSKNVEVFTDYITAQKLLALPHIKAFKFRGWRSLDNEHLIINASPQNPYLITLNGPCPELKFAHGIAINHSGTNLLYSGKDSISIPKFPEQKCYIKTIYALNDEQADQVVQLARHRGV